MALLEDVTGEGNKEDLFFHWELTNADGATFTLYRETHHTDEDVKKAKRWIKNNRDAVKINVKKLP